MASRITPNMARKIQKHWSDKDTGKYQEAYFGQNQQTKRRSLTAQLGRYAKAMGFQASKASGKSADRAAYDHINRLARMKPKQEKALLARRVQDADKQMDMEFKAGRAGRSAQRSIKNYQKAEADYFEAHNRNKGS